MLHSSKKILVVVAVGTSGSLLLLLVLLRAAGDSDRVPASFARPEQLAIDGSLATPSTIGASERALPSEASPASPSSAPVQVPAESIDRLVAAREELAFFATDSLNGMMYVNEVLEHLREIASLPVEVHPDFEYEDNDAIAYAITGLPEGLDGHMLVGLKPYDENGKRYRYLQMDIHASSSGPELLDGALREKPNVSVSISYDCDDPTTPVRLALMLQRAVDFERSREVGIDPYSGRYTQGAYYCEDLLDGRVFSSTIGMVNGNPADNEVFQGVNPLAGDTHLDPDLLSEVLAQLHKNLSSVKGE